MILVCVSLISISLSHSLLFCSPILIVVYAMSCPKTGITKVSESVSLSCRRPLHLAARSGLKQVVQELLSRGANVEVLDENGTYPLSRLAAPPPCLQLPVGVLSV